MNISIVLCEGPHDAAFLSRILRTNGYTSYNNKIRDYPQYLSRFILEQIKIDNAQDLNLNEARFGKMIPSYALLHQEHLIVIYVLRGDSQKERRRVIVSAFHALYNHNGISMVTDLTDRMRICYVYDADDRGVEQRLSEINQELKEFIGFANCKIGHGKTLQYNNLCLGAFIFHNNDQEWATGRLEDLYLPLMCQSNEDLEQDVSAILDKRHLYRCISAHLTDKKYNKDYDQEKAKGCMMGQLQKSGSALPAIIEQSALISENDILKSQICQEIYQFLNWE